MRDDVNCLDCVVCGGWFSTFEALARHMKAAHDPHPAGVARRYRVRSYEREPRQRNTPLAKKTTARTATRKNNGNIPAPSQDAPSTFSPFLKAEHIGRKEGSKATLTLKPANVRIVDGNFGEQIIVPVELNGKNYDWAITMDSVNHRILFDRFGGNPKKWAGRVMVITKMSQSNRLYVAAVSNS